MYEPHVIYTNIPEAKNEGKIKKKKKINKNVLLPPRSAIYLLF